MVALGLVRWASILYGTNFQGLNKAHEFCLHTIYCSVPHASCFWIYSSISSCFHPTDFRTNRRPQKNMDSPAYQLFTALPIFTNSASDLGLIALH